MRKIMTAFGIVFVMASKVIYAEAEFDFEELMETIEDNAHELQANIATQDVDAAFTLTKELKDAFKLVEGYFEKWGDAQDAVSDSKKYQVMVDEIVRFLEERNFESASDQAIEFSQACDKACHDKYKPL